MSCIRKVRKAKGNTADNSAVIQFNRCVALLYFDLYRCHGNRSRFICHGARQRPTLVL